MAAMALGLRGHFPGTLYRVIGRGNQRQKRQRTPQATLGDLGSAAPGESAPASKKRSLTPVPSVEQNMLGTQKKARNAFCSCGLY